MNLKSQTLEICRAYEIKPSRSKGQNFLVAPEVYDEVIAAAELKESDLVLEVGPGLGFLTERLAADVKKVLAVELDDKISEFLQTKIITHHLDNVKLINTDILDFKVAESVLAKEPYKIVANLPYNITSIFLRRFLETEYPPEVLVLLLQREVAERIIATPGEMSMLAVSIQFYATAEIIKIVPPDAFYPPPKIESAIIRIKLKTKKDLPSIDRRAFFRLVKFGFAAKRKMLKNNLAGALKIEQKIIIEILAELNLNPQIRAQELSVKYWLDLFARLEKFMV
jgi:16S rRNA (adenine1518-N6/adenine1519-N6)-dimethyltransferase